MRTTIPMKAAATLSQDFIRDVHRHYDWALNDLISERVVRHGTNCYTRHAAPAYVAAVAAIESFLNEIAFGSPAKSLLADSFLWELKHDWVERLELTTKLMLVPQLLFGRSFEKGAPPFQDTALLVKVRNEVVHYKMRRSEPRYIQPLVERGIALPARSDHVDYVWIHKLCSSEGIRWANNTVCDLAKTLVTFMPDGIRDLLFSALLVNFQEIGESVAREKLAEAGIELTSD